MLVKTDDLRNINTDSRLACSLAFVAGALNTTAFQIVGFFSANMTGNVSSLSDNLANARLTSGAFFLEIILFFIGGAVFSTLIINAGRRHGVNTIFAVNIVLEALGLIALGSAEILRHTPLAGSTLVLALSFLMGLQNAVVTRISNARVRTTHVSGTITDIGIELAMLIDILRRKSSPKETPIFLERLQLHVITVCAFLAGGVVGIWFYRLMGNVYLILFGIGLLTLSVCAIVQTLRHASVKSQDMSRMG